MATITVYLFGKPAWEIENLEGELTPLVLKQINELGPELAQRLEVAGNNISKLINNGWSGYGGLYDVMLSKDVSVEEATKELETLGIDSDTVNIEEDTDDEEEFNEIQAEDSDN